MKKFSLKECEIPQIWCGETNKAPKGYARSGTKYECMQKGFGAGMYSERAKGLPPNSLQNIKYVGDKHEESFKEHGIKDIPKLVELSKKGSSIGGTLKKILTKSNGVLDAKAYNSTLVYLHKKGINDLPRCQKIKV